jgi:acetyltransferase-like isoleucine patch superfamily enzyme
MIYLFGINPISDYILENIDNSIIEFIVSDEYYKNESHSNIKIKKLSQINFSIDDVVYNCLGYKNLALRNEIGNFFRKKRILKSFVSKKSNISKNTNIADGNIIMDHVSIELNVSIDSDNIFWSGSRVCHDTKIGKSNFFASGSIIGGGCTVQNFSFFGFNSSVKQNTILDDSTFVQANYFFQ